MRAEKDCFTLAPYPACAKEAVDVVASVHAASLRAEQGVADVAGRAFASIALEFPSSRRYIAHYPGIA